MKVLTYMNNNQILICKIFQIYRQQFHCQFFGKSADRSWISCRAILHWEENRTAQEQFEKLTQVLKEKYNGRKKGKRKSFSMKSNRDRIRDKVEIKCSKLSIEVYQLWKFFQKSLRNYPVVNEFI